MMTLNLDRTTIIILLFLVGGIVLFAFLFGRSTGILRGYEKGMALYQNDTNASS